MLLNHRFNHRVHRALYGSPTHWGEVWDRDAFIPVEDLDDPSHGDNDGDGASDMSGSEGSIADEDNSLKIQFHSGNTAEAMDKRKFGFEQRQEDLWTATEDLWWKMDDIDDVVNEEKNEETLRSEFESEVNNRIPEIGEDVLPWDTLSTVRD